MEAAAVRAFGTTAMGGGASRHLCEALLLELINGFTAEGELGNGELLHQFSFIGLRYVRHIGIVLQDRESRRLNLTRGWYVAPRKTLSGASLERDFPGAWPIPPGALLPVG